MLLALPVLAKSPARYVQTHVNLTLSCQDLAGAMQNLQGLAGQLGGVVTNSNLQLEGGSANANLRLPPEQVAAFLAQVKSFGDVQNESVSTSDNTRSYEEAATNLAIAERMAAAEWAPKTPVSPSDRLVFEAEFKNYLKDRINNHRSNMASYEENRRYAEVSINLQSQPRARRVPAPPPEQALQQPDGPPPAPAPSTPQTKHHIGLLIIPSVFLGVCLAYFVFTRRPQN
jgi:hypothetical protein